MKILFAVPTLDGAARLSTVKAIAEARGVCAKRDIQTKLIYSDHNVIDRARDHLASESLRLECDRLFFVDSDVSFDAESFERLLDASLLHKGIVAGIYRHRGGDPRNRFSVRPIIGSLMESDGTIPIEGGPAGFMMIDAAVLVSMIARGARFYNRGLTARLFEGEWVDDELLGEDFSFCRRAGALGFGVRAVSNLALGHEGSMVYRGSWPDSDGR